jgi:hypothetical protein
MRENILAVYSRATDAERSEGVAWYEAAHTFAVGLSERYGITLEQAAGVIAAISPRMPWAENMRKADELCRTGEAGMLKVNKARALAILAGESPDTALACATCKRGSHAKHTCSGEKVRNFYRCILDPSDAYSVCVDRHAYDVAKGKVGDDVSRKALDRVGAYREIADAYRQAAVVLGISPATVQAVTWVRWRNEKAA